MFCASGHVGRFVISKRGHDRGGVYVVVCAAGNNYLVANGLNRTIQNPKKKNPLHLEITSRSVPDIDGLLGGERVCCNLKLARHIKEFG